MSIWAVTSMAPGGTETVNMELRDGGMDPWTVISAWDYTSLSDPRATFKRDVITIRHLPLDERFKIGIDRVQHLYALETEMQGLSGHGAYVITDMVNVITHEYWSLVHG